MTDDPRAVVRYCPGCGGTEFTWAVPRRDDKERQICLGCGYVHYVGPALAAGVILVDGGGRLCLVRRAHDPGRGKWTFPGGFVDLDEEPAAAARREAVEETGCATTIERLLGAYRSMGPRDRRVVILVYLGRLAAADAADACEEVEEVRWFEAAALPWDEFAFASTAQALRDYLG